MLVVIQGKVNAKDRDGKTTEEVKVMADKAKRLDTSVLKHYIATGEKIMPDVDPSTTQSVDRIIITLKDLKDQTALLQLKSTLQSVPGETETLLLLSSTGQKIRLPYKIAVSEKLKQTLAGIISEDAIKVE
jgi:hypothetical protein